MVRVHAFVKYLSDEKWERQEQGGWRDISAVTNLQHTSRAVRRAAWLFSHQSLRHVFYRAAHWFTKDRRLSIFFAAVGPGKQLFFPMKAAWAVGTSLPPGLLWATSWAPAPASLCSGLSDQFPRLTRRAAGGMAHTGALAGAPPGPLCSFQLV